MIIQQFLLILQGIPINIGIMKGLEQLFTFSEWQRCNLKILYFEISKMWSTYFVSCKLVQILHILTMLFFVYSWQNTCVKIVGANFGNYEIIHFWCKFISAMLCPEKLRVDERRDKSHSSLLGHHLKFVFVCPSIWTSIVLKSKV